MALPNVIYGKFGDEKKSASAKNTGITLGTQMVLPGGQEFRYCKASATAMVAGKFYQQEAGVQAGDVRYKGSVVVVSGGAAGSTSVVLTAGGTTGVTTDLFADGYLVTAGSAGSGNGYTYRVKTCSSAAAGSSFTVNLEPSDPFKVALAAATNLVGLRENEYTNLLLTTADTVGVGALAGVSPVAIVANYYGWVQTSGPALCFTDGVVIVGEPVCVSNAVAGAVEPIPPAAADSAGVRVVKEMVKVGTVMNVAASTAYSLIDLCVK